MLIVSFRHQSPPTDAPPRLSRFGAESGENDSKTPLLLNIEHEAERDVPLLCIVRFLSNLAAGCDIVFIVERVIGNPQVRKDFPNG